ncbi:MAG: hypothetical protein JSU61_10100 [Fidelibacterota bacterium]|nr:MAG: hypothetical protein JSU61_10100 [Candidatus Neomarinimicrobiota bacterium]
MNRSILLIVVLLSTLTAQGSKLFWDGYNWREMDRLTQEYPEFRLPMKRAYVRGILNDKLYHYLQAWSADTIMANTLFRDYLGRFAIDQLIRGTDQFYQDPANLYLPVISALVITSLRAMGFPDSVVSEYTQASRDWINELTIRTSEEVPIRVEGIAKPPLPKTPESLYLPPPVYEVRKWYNPEYLILP